MKIILKIGLLSFLFVQTFTFKVEAQEDDNWQQVEGRIYVNSEGQLGFATNPNLIGTPQVELGELCKNVYLTTIGSNYETSLNEVIDTASFVDLNASFFKDKNYIYRYYPMCEGGYLLKFSSDTSNFRILNSCYVIHDTTIWYYKGKIVNADLSTFEFSEIHPCLAKDKNGFIEFGERVSIKKLITAMGEDNFKKLEFTKLIKNHNDTVEYSVISNIFYKGTNGKIYIKTRSLIRPPEEFGPDFYREVPVLDVESYDHLSGGYYAKDKFNVYGYRGTTDGTFITRIEEADVNSFSVINFKLGKDKNHVFYRGDIIEGINVDSLVILCHNPNMDFHSSYGLIKDNKSVYFNNQKIKTIDVDSFECNCEGSTIIYQDKDWIYHEDYFLSLDPEKRTKRN